MHCKGTICATCRPRGRTKNTVIPRQKRRALGITIVSKNTEPIVEAYLRRAGVSIHRTRSIERAADTVPPSAAAVVFFADDFRALEVAAALTVLGARLPKVLVVLVTADPASFLSLPSSDAAASLVLPKPVWGWTILDAIRAHLEPPLAREASEYRGVRPVRQP